MTDETVRAIFAAVIGLARSDLEESRRNVLSLREFVDAFLAGRVRPTDANILRARQTWRRELESYRSARKFFVGPRSESTFELACALIEQCPRRVREELRPLLALPWNAKLLAERISAFGRRRRRAAA